MGNGLAHSPSEMVQKVLDQMRDVFAPMAQRRDVDGEDVQSEEQIGAKAILFHGRRQLPMGGGDYPYIDGDWRRRADPLDDAIL